MKNTIKMVVGSTTSNGHNCWAMWMCPACGTEYDPDDLNYKNIVICSCGQKLKTPGSR